MKNQRATSFLLFSILFVVLSIAGFAQEEGQEGVREGMLETLKFKDADIRVVLQAITQKAIKDGQKVNILVAPEIQGLVTVDLTNVHWQTTLEAVLKTYDYDYEWVGDNIILVDTLESLADKRQKAAEAKVAEPLETTTYKLGYLDANDVKKLIEAQLTPRGKISVLEIEPLKGWKARGGYGVGGGDAAAGAAAGAVRVEGARPRSRILVITDTKTNLRNILAALKEIDIMPTQVLIEARIMEVSRDRLKDIGIDYGTQREDLSVSPSTVVPAPLGIGGNTSFVGTMETGDVGPAVFDPRASIGDSLHFDTGLELIFQKLTGTEFQIILHALEEDVHTNVLSAPRILTIDGQEAYIMIGEKRPIISSTIESSEGAVGINSSLDYYQNLGIELNVVPQVAGNDHVNMIIYPSVTSSSAVETATSSVGGAQIVNEYPVILVRETQTQILVKDGETIVIGGLLKDVESESVFKVPILGDIPLLGLLFQRRTTDTEKIDLVIFITVTILRPEETVPAEAADAGGQVPVSESSAAGGQS